MTTESPVTTVGSIMSREVVGVQPTQSIREALEVMLAQRVGAVPVVKEDGACVGILSTRDLLEIGYEFDRDVLLHHADDIVGCLLSWEEVSEAIGSQVVSDLMTVAFHSLPPRASWKEAAKMMVQASIHRLPVIDPDDGKIVGIVSTTDIVRAVAENN